MSAGEKDGEHRANPLSVVVEALKMASGLVTLAAFGQAGGLIAGDAGALVTLAGAAALIFAACLALSFVVWRVRTWELADEGLVVRWGLLNRRRLTVPYERIHTVSVNSTLFERVFGLVTLDLDTGAAATEGDASKISGLRESEAETLRAELLRRKRAGEAPAGEKDAGALAPSDPDAPRATFTLTNRQLLLAAASHVSAVGQAFALVVLLGNGVTQFAEWGLFDLDGAGSELAAAEVPALLPLVVGFIVVAMVLGAVISFAVNLLRYAGYRIERYDDRVVVEHGLLSRSSRTIVAGRVQFVSVRQGFVRQLIGYAEVSAQVVAAPGDVGGEPAGSVLLHPFVRMDEVDGFLAQVLPAYAGVLGVVELRALGSVARRRAVARAAIWWPFAVLIIGGALWLFGLSGLLESAGWLLRPVLVATGILSVVLLAVLIFDALRAWDAARYGHTARELVFVSGGFTRRTTVVPGTRLQRLSVSASPFQCRAGVATVSARTAAGSEEGLSLRDLPAADADDLLAWFRPRGRELNG